jgi:hypothetical protein
MRQLANGPLAAMADSKDFRGLIHLGRGAFTINDGKNAAMAMVSLFFPKITHVLHVDDDLVFPRGFGPLVGPLPSLTAIGVSGSPDLCRLEWLELYLGCVAKRARIFDGPRPQGLVASLLKKERLPLLFDVIGRYTDLRVPVDRKTCKRAGWIRTTREFSCASFISDVRNYPQSISRLGTRRIGSGSMQSRMVRRDSFRLRSFRKRLAKRCSRGWNSRSAARPSPSSPIAQTAHLCSPNTGTWPRGCAAFSNLRTRPNMSHSSRL